MPTVCGLFSKEVSREKRNPIITCGGNTCDAETAQTPESFYARKSSEIIKSSSSLYATNKIGSQHVNLLKGLYKYVFTTLEAEALESNTLHCYLM